MKFTVNRKTWYRGKKGSSLLRPDGMMCCLGHLSIACGISSDMILNLAMPYDMEHCYPEEYEKMPEKLKPAHVAQGELASINDNYGMSDEERERRLTTGFADHDIEVEFTN